MLVSDGASTDKVWRFVEKEKETCMSWQGSRLLLTVENRFHSYAIELLSQPQSNWYLIPNSTWFRGSSSEPNRHIDNDNFKTWGFL